MRQQVLKKWENLTVRLVLECKTVHYSLIIMYIVTPSGNYVIIFGSNFTAP